MNVDFVYESREGEPIVGILARDLYDRLQHAGVGGNPLLEIAFRYPL